MKRLFYLFLAVSFTVFYSCGNITEKIESEVEKELDELTEELTDDNGIEINYLEDFAQFENHGQIVEFYGEDNVEKTEVWVAEGTMSYWASVVYPDSKNKIIVYWASEDCKEMESVENTYSTYNNEGELTTDGGLILPSETGLSLGSSLPDIEELNGAEFTFYGLSWDYGGTVVDLSAKFDDYILFVGWPEGDVATEWPDEYYNIIGDVEFSSQNKDALSLGLELVSITYVVNM